MVSAAVHSDLSVLLSSLALPASIVSSRTSQRSFKWPSAPQARIQTSPSKSFFAPQQTTADAYLFRQVFLNHPDVSARKILQALRPALRPGSRVIIIEYVMPPLGTAPQYAEVATRRLDNAMYCLMKGKIRELEEFKTIVAEEVPELTFWSVKEGEMRATHDPRSHSVLEWRWEEKEPVTNGGESNSSFVDSEIEVSHPTIEATANEAVEKPEVKLSVAEIEVAEVEPVVIVVDTPKELEGAQAFVERIQAAATVVNDPVSTDTAVQTDAAIDLMPTDTCAEPVTEAAPQETIPEPTVEAVIEPVLVEVVSEPRHITILDLPTSKFQTIVKTTEVIDTN